MLEIRNEAGLTLQLPSDQQLTVEINSTIFDTDDIIRGSYSYPFKFGLNENNCRFINNGHLPESPVAPDMSVLVIAGSYSFRAMLSYKTSGIYADAFLLIDMGEITDKIRNVPLREFVTEILFVSTDELGTKPTLQKLAEAEPNIYPVVFPPYYNSQQVENEWKPEEVPTYVKPVLHNVYYPDLNMYSGTISGDGDRILVPMVYVCWLLSHVCKKLGFQAQGTFFTDPELCRLIIFNTQSIPGLDPLSGEYTVNIGRHLGDYTIASFIKALRSYIGISIEMDLVERKATFNTYQKLKGAREYVDLSNYMIPESDGIENSGIRGYVVNTFTDESDEYQNNILDSATGDQSFYVRKEIAKTSLFSVGTAKNDIQLEIGTVGMRMQNGRNSSKWLLPTVIMKGNNADPFFETSETYSPYENENELDKTIPDPVNPWGFRLLIYWGMQQNSEGDKYPYASSVTYDSKYNVFGNVSLQPGEPDSIWWIHQRAYYEFLALSKKVDALFRLPVSELSRIRISDQIGFRLQNFVLGRYLIEKFTYELPADEGFVYGKIESRQLTSKLLKAEGGEVSGKKSTWVQMRIENIQTIQTPSGAEQHGDVVVYLWKDGLYTIPETGKSVVLNYKVRLMTRDVSGKNNYAYTEETVTIGGARNVLHSNVYLAKSHILVWLRHTMYILYQSRDYRVR